MRLAIVATPIVEMFKGTLHVSYMDAYHNNPHLAVYLLAGILERANIPVHIVDLTERQILDPTVVDHLMDYDLICFSANSMNWPAIRQIILWLKERKSKAKMAVGGIHVTFFWKAVLRRTPVDFLIRGEGDRAIIPLVHAVEKDSGYEDVPGLVRLADGKPLMNSPATLLTPKELGTLPAPAYERLTHGIFKTIAIESSRGCAGNCSFCAIPFRHRWRYVPAAAFVENVERLQPYLDKAKYQHFSIVDDCFTVDKQRVMQIVKLAHRRRVDFKATYDARILDFQDEKLIAALAPHSRGILLGAESFNPKTLRRIGKPINSKQIERAALLAARYKLADQTIFSFIIGFPWETFKDVRENIRQILDLALNYGVRIFLQWHTLTPGSRLWAEQVAKKKVCPENLDEIGFLSGQQWYDISSNLTTEERLEISDIVSTATSIMLLSKPYGDRHSEVMFIVPPFLTGNVEHTEAWRRNYLKRMSHVCCS